MQALNPGGTPEKGGTLNMLGAGDVDVMDDNLTARGLSLRWPMLSKRWNGADEVRFHLYGG